MIDFLIIGGTKCGSTSLADFVTKSQTVNFCSVKEPSVLNRRNFSEKDLAYYKSLFADRPGLKGEATPAYSDFKQVDAVIANLKAIGSRPKIVLSARNQVKRLESHFLEMIKAGKLNHSNVHTFFLNNFGNFTRGMYGHVVRKYANAFGIENVLVLNFDKLIVNDQSELQKCVDFLEIELPSPFMFPASNKSMGAYKKNFLVRFYKNYVAATYKRSGLPSLQRLAPLVGNVLSRKLTNDDRINLTQDQINFVNDIYEYDLRLFEQLVGWNYSDLRM